MKERKQKKQIFMAEYENIDGIEVKRVKLSAKGKQNSMKNYLQMES